MKEIDKFDYASKYREVHSSLLFEQLKYLVSLVVNGIKVLSLFDGISCGQLALQRAGIPVASYSASEIDKNAIAITQHHFPDTVQLGNVRGLSFKDMSVPDLLIGGSPCQDLSTAGKGLGLGPYNLFWEFVRALYELNPRFWFFENVRMKKDWEDTISNCFGVDPIHINSSLVSAQNRQRSYWTNIPNVTIPEDREIFIKDIVYDNSYKVFQDNRVNETKKISKNYVCWDFGKGHWSQAHRAYFPNKKLGTIVTQNIQKLVVDVDNNIFRKVHPIELERCQTLPDNYTKVSGISLSDRVKAIGNGWTVDVVAHIFKNLKNFI